MANKGREKKEIADELEQYLSEGDADKIFSDDEDEEVENEEMEEEKEEFEEAEKKVEEIPEEPELVEEEPVIEPQDLPEETEEKEEEPEEEPELPEEKIEEPEEPEEEEELEAEVKTKEELDKEFEKEIQEEEKAKPKAEAPKEREKLAIEKMSCEAIATVNGYLLGVAAIEFAFFYTLSCLLAHAEILRTGIDGRTLLLHTLECFAYTVILFLVASLFNNILRERKGKIGLAVLLFGEIVLIACFIAEIIVYANAVLLMF